jgi:hypothetical protein
MLNEHCVDRPDLDTVSAAGVAYFCGFDVVVAIWLQKRKGSESLNQLGSRLWPGKPLQQLLEDQAGSEHLICAFKGASKNFYGLCGSVSVTAEGQRPDGGINEQTHDRRARSAL